jgi:hypothetical protein
VRRHPQEILTEIPLGKHNREPVLRVQKMENAKKALDRIKEMGVQLTNIGPEGKSDARGEAGRPQAGAQGLISAWAGPQTWLTGTAS